MAITFEELNGQVSIGIAEALQAALSQPSESSVQMVVIKLPFRPREAVETTQASTEATRVPVSESKATGRKPGRPAGAKDRDTAGSRANRSISQTTRYADPAERARLRVAQLQIAARKAEEELQRLEGLS